VETIEFEAVKTSLRQDAKGFALNLIIHPDEIPDLLVRDFVGARYMVVMVRLNGDEKPHEPNHVSRAAVLCKDKKFQEFLYLNNLTFEQSLTATEQAVRDICGISSRAELNTNVSAKESFLQLVNQFEEWKHGPTG
jgi:hypothetical protein